MVPESSADVARRPSRLQLEHNGLEEDDGRGDDGDGHADLRHDRRLPHLPRRLSGVLSRRDRGRAEDYQSDVAMGC